MTSALLPTDWILRYTATANMMAMVKDEPITLLPNSTFSLSETEALSLLALFQRRGQPLAITILHRPEVQ